VTAMPGTQASRLVLRLDRVLTSTEVTLIEASDVLASRVFSAGTGAPGKVA